MYHLRCLVPVYRSVMSITGQYWYAFVWENEIHDLFGLKIDFIERDVDYGGHFYHLAEKTPWHDLPGEKHADQAIKVQLRSGLDRRFRRGRGETGRRERKWVKAQ